jgi:tRNA(fMet)-specific endonuclease VapC
LAATGKALAALDMLIAAHALSANAVLVTHDKAFLQITASLNVIDWATDL